MLSMGRVVGVARDGRARTGRGDTPRIEEYTLSDSKSQSLRHDIVIPDS